MLPEIQKFFEKEYSPAQLSSIIDDEVASLRITLMNEYKADSIEVGVGVALERLKILATATKALKYKLNPSSDEPDVI